MNDEARRVSALSISGDVQTEDTSGDAMRYPRSRGNDVGGWGTTTDHAGPPLFAFLRRHCCLLGTFYTTMSKRYNEKRARMAEQALDRELDSGYGKVDAETNAAFDSRDAAMGKGEEALFERKMTKEEKKAAAKAARDAKKKAKEAKSGKTPAKETENSTEEPRSVKSELDLRSLSLEDAEQAKRDADLEKLSQDNIIVTYEAKKEKLHANARDINVDGVTVTFHGKPLIEETSLVINYGNRYGFIGPK